MAINTLFKNIADAIRAKTGSAGSLTPAQMPGAIANIPSGEFEAFHIWTRTHVSGDASVYVQRGTYDFSRATPFISNEEAFIIEFASGTYTEYALGTIAKIAYYVDSSWNWGVNAVKNVYSTIDGLKAANSRVHTWYYNISVDFIIWG